MCVCVCVGACVHSLALLPPPPPPLMLLGAPCPHRTLLGLFWALLFFCVHQGAHRGCQGSTRQRTQYCLTLYPYFDLY